MNMHMSDVDMASTRISLDHRFSRLGVVLCISTGSVNSTKGNLLLERGREF